MVFQVLVLLASCKIEWLNQLRILFHLHCGLSFRQNVGITILEILPRLSAVIVKHSGRKRNHGTCQPEEVVPLNEDCIRAKSTSKAQGGKDNWHIVGIQLSWFSMRSSGGGQRVRGGEHRRCFLNFSIRNVSKLLTKLESIDLLIPMNELNGVSEAGQGVCIKGGNTLPKSGDVKLECVEVLSNTAVPFE